MRAPKSVWLRRCGKYMNSNHMRWKTNHRARVTWTSCWMKWRPSPAMGKRTARIWTRLTLTTPVTKPMTPPLDRRVSIAGRVKAYLPYTQARPEYVAEGRLLRMVGLTREAIDPRRHIPAG